MINVQLKKTKKHLNLSFIITVLVLLSTSSPLHAFSTFYHSSSSSSSRRIVHRQSQPTNQITSHNDNTSSETTISPPLRKTPPPPRPPKKKTPPVVPKRKIRSLFSRAKHLEKTGQWNESAKLLRRILTLDPFDSYSYLALGRLESRRNNSDEARRVFQTGIRKCPKSVHLLHAYALLEETSGDVERARLLFRKALELDETNPYVCHAFGLMELRTTQNTSLARTLWTNALQTHPTAAILCSLGESYVTHREYQTARRLYQTYIPTLPTPRDLSEAYLAAAWLEEKQFRDWDRAKALLQKAIQVCPSQSSRAHVALARLESRMGGGTGMKERLKKVCKESMGDKEGQEDGRLFNAWASAEVKSGDLEKAKQILRRGMVEHPNDHSLFQAAGKVEERTGNYTGARHLYSTSLSIEPSAPTLVAFALLELHHPSPQTTANHTKIKRLFEEAILLDPRHGPTYNAYGNTELRLHNNVDEARKIYNRGIKAHCTDPASVYHGYAKVELSQGNIETAKSILREGIDVIEKRQRHQFLETNMQHRGVFLSHTLGMLELNGHRVADAKKVFWDGLDRYENSSRLLLGAALCEVRLGNEEKARELFERSVNADKRHAHAWQNWGVMEMTAGNFTVAKTLFECGIRSCPNHGALWQAYATMESRCGNFDVARTLFAAGIKQCPNHVPLYQAWARLELRHNNFHQSKRLIGEALTRDKTQGSGWLIAAKIEQKQGNTGLIGLILRRGLECAPNDPELYCALGDYELNRGKIDSARNLLNVGLDIDPTHAPTYHALAELEAKVFNIEGLSKLNKRAAEVFNSNALVPPPAAMTTASRVIWGKKIKMGKTKKLPEGVAALAEQVVLEYEDRIRLFEDDGMKVDPEGLIETMSRFEDEVVGDIFSVNSKEGEESGEFVK